MYLGPQRLSTEDASLQCRVSIMENIVADAPGLDGVAPLLQPGAGLFLDNAIRMMMKGLQGAQEILSRHL